MDVYITLLFFIIPYFSVSIGIEAFVAKFKGVNINNSEDMISSLSSGLTNTMRDVMKISIIVISYPFLEQNFTLYKVEPLWLAVIFAFIIKDFSGYWIHRMNHRVNIFWNRHYIHHSSENYNLSCALRQSISNSIQFTAIFMIPAALLGIPASIFVILSPIHLFLQFWYHTQLIGNLGFLEYILVTPSHHRVHHAINPEYIDKNYSQIFIIWDKIFGTFQPELANVIPVYGTLKPAKTWNPILINFKHLFQLLQDAWRTKNYWNKLIIWFMPTGWRPNDVSKKYPLDIIQDPHKQVKYYTNNTQFLITWSWAQLIITSVLMFHMFINIMNYNNTLIYAYTLFLFLNIFSYTSTLDQKSFSLIVEFFKTALGISLIFYQDFSWFGVGEFGAVLLMVYMLISTYITFISLKSSRFG